MATQTAPDGTEYVYDPSDPVAVARVAAHCDPSYEEQRKRAAAAFAKAAPEAAKDAAQAAANAAALTPDAIRDMIAQAVAAAMAAKPTPVEGATSSPVDPGPAFLGAGDPTPTPADINQPIAGISTPVEGSQGNA